MFDSVLCVWSRIDWTGSFSVSAPVVHWSHQQLIFLNIRTPTDCLSSPSRKQAHSCLFLLISVCVLNLMILCLFQCISADERDLKTYLSNLPAFFGFNTLLRNSLPGHSPSRHATLLWPTDPFCVDRPVLLPPSLSIPIKIIHAYLWDCPGNWIIGKFPSALRWTWLFLSSP